MPRLCSDLLRQLLAVSLCSVSSTSPSHSASLPGSRTSLQKAREANGPSVATIVDATRLLERIGQQSSFGLLFASMPPNSMRSRKAENGSHTDEGRNKRSRQTLEQTFDEEDTDLFSSTSDCPAKSISRQIAECKTVWQVLALEDLVECSTGERSKKPVQRRRRAASRSQREGEESLLCRKAYDREAVWRVVELLLQGWDGEVTAILGGLSLCVTYLCDQILTLLVAGDPDAASASHLLQQFAEEQSVRDPLSNSRKVPCDNIGDAFDIIFAALAPTSLMRRDREKEKSKKSRLSERVWRGKVGVALLVEVSQLQRVTAWTYSPSHPLTQLFRLAHVGHLDRRAVVRGTADLLVKCDRLAIGLLCSVRAQKRNEQDARLTCARSTLSQAMKKRGMYFELGQAISIGLEASQEEEERIDVGEGAAEEYEKWIKSLLESNDVGEQAKVLLKSIPTLSWLYTTPRKNIERLVLERHGRLDANEVAQMTKNSKVRALLDRWTDIQNSGSSSQGKESRRDISWKELAFALSWKLATLQARVERYHLKSWMVKVIVSVDESTSSEASKGLASLCVAELQKMSEREKEWMDTCHAEMLNTCQQRQALDSGGSSDEEEAKLAVGKHLADCATECEHLANEVRVAVLLEAVEGATIVL